MEQERATRPAASGGTGGGNVFRREGEYWTIAYDGAVWRLRDTAGLRYLAHLLQRPGERVAAIDLARLARTPRGYGVRDKADAAELARVKTTRSIRAALERIGTLSAPLIVHLRASIKTGAFCSYTPDPRLPVEWSCDPGAYPADPTARGKERQP